MKTGWICGWGRSSSGADDGAGMEYGSGSARGVKPSGPARRSNGIACSPPSVAKPTVYRQTVWLSSPMTIPYAAISSGVSGRDVIEEITRRRTMISTDSGWAAISTRPLSTRRNPVRTYVPSRLRPGIWNGSPGAVVRCWAGSMPGPESSPSTRSPGGTSPGARSPRAVWTTVGLPGSTCWLAGATSSVAPRITRSARVSSWAETMLAQVAATQIATTTKARSGPTMQSRVVMIAPGVSIA